MYRKCTVNNPVNKICSAQNTLGSSMQRTPASDDVEEGELVDEQRASPRPTLATPLRPPSPPSPRRPSLDERASRSRRDGNDRSIASGQDVRQHSRDSRKRRSHSRSRLYERESHSRYRRAERPHHRESVRNSYHPHRSERRGDSYDRDVSGSRAKRARRSRSRSLSFDRRTSGSNSRNNSTVDAKRKELRHEAQVAAHNDKEQPETELETDLHLQNAEDLALEEQRLIEGRRKRRQAILERHKSEGDNGEHIDATKRNDTSPVLASSAMTGIPNANPPSVYPTMPILSDDASQASLVRLEDFSAELSIRRQAISPSAVKATSIGVELSVSTIAVSVSGDSLEQDVAPLLLGTRKSCELTLSDSSVHSSFELDKINTIPLPVVEEQKPERRLTQVDIQSDVSAADYNPTKDGIEDDIRHSANRGQYTRFVAHKTVEEMALLRDKDAHERVVNHTSPQNQSHIPILTDNTAVTQEDDMFAADYQETDTTALSNLDPCNKTESNGHHKAQQLPQQQRRLQPDIRSNDLDMFQDDVDMFAIENIAALKNVNTMSENVYLTREDNWDDPEGYYRVVIGEILDKRYQVQSVLGKGVFSTVVKAMDSLENKEVAIKFIRSNETMYKSGLKELSILKRLMKQDSGDKKHVIRLYRHFEHRGHLCLVFESLSMNLREVLKRYGNNVGLNIKAVRVYAYQLLQSLSLLKRCGILHADLKPDNILVTENRNVLKLCDLGSASDASENDITPYLVSRFYRAPEIILGLSYEYSIDMWSAACTLYELCTGKILFPGRSNNQMLKLHMELKGRFPNRMLKRGQFVAQHFDGELWDFHSIETDKLTGKEVVRAIQYSKPVKDMRARFAGEMNNDTERGQLTALFVDFLEKALTLNAEKRMTISEALRHPFITGKTKTTKDTTGRV